MYLSPGPTPVLSPGSNAGSALVIREGVFYISSLLAVVLIVACGGCRRNENDANLPLRSAGLQKQKVIAQGQILPADGFVRLSATPGDVVEEILVEVGDAVTVGQPLLVMRSEQISQTQLATLRARRQEAERERSNAIDQAEQQVAAVRLKLEQLDAQQASLQRKANLLDIAHQQVVASQKVLDKLETISQDAVTREFVGQLEIDRQRIAVAEADLEYRSQVEAHQQAKDDLHWANQAAEKELAAAENLLQAARATRALEILDLEIEALQKQGRASRIVAPTDGVILALNANEGEASVQLPLVEMANLDQLVCEVEINEIDAARVEPGQPATIASRAFGDQRLTGSVAQKFKLVGRPQLRPLDPLARVDYRTITAIIELSPSANAIARDWLQLQVEAEIDIDGRSESSGGEPTTSGAVSKEPPEASGDAPEA